ncbi:MAG: hypothetical protein WBR15_02335 [Gammaproteobacteria bacterium]
MKAVVAMILTALLSLGFGSVYAQTMPSPHATPAPTPASQPTPPPAPKAKPVPAKTRTKPACMHEDTANHDTKMIVGQSEAAWTKAKNRSRQKTQALKPPACVPPGTGDLP